MTQQTFEHTPKRKRRRSWLIAGVCILLALILAAGCYFAFLRPELQEERSEQPATMAAPQILTATDPVLPEPAPIDSEPVIEEPAPEEPEEPSQPEEPAEAEKPESPAFPPLETAPAFAKDEAGIFLPAVAGEGTLELDLQVYSENALLIDVQSNTVLAEKAADARIYPASMTKIMTALVACELVEDWDDTFRMTQDIIDPYFLADATMAGFVHNEEVTMLDLVYGTILPSGAEATEGLAIHLTGSVEAFVEKMNEKAAALGLTDTYFVDASGLHNEEHYTTLRDLSIILQAAMENDVCRQVLSTASYTSQATWQNPEGVDMYNKFLLRAETADQGGALILGAKTGYTNQAMNCCASFGYAPDGRLLLCITAHAWTGDFCLADHIALYSLYS